jgi:eukaryotic-like serine/threonine-protein kinase
MLLSSGTRLGPYEILDTLGAGSMGEVYLGRDTRIDRRVAIKVLSPNLLADAAARERFEREARAIGILSHPHICTLYDIGYHNDLRYLVLEYLQGETLAERLARRARKPASKPSGSSSATPTSDSGSAGASGRRAPLPIAETLRIAIEVAEALAAAHRAGIIHRDLKPSNIMLTRTGVKVLDFGLAKLRPSAEGAELISQTATAATPLTGAGLFIGTLPYMAPEQLEGRSVDARTDIFAFGSIVYEMVTGRRAFLGDSQASVISAILDRDPEPVSALLPLVSPGVDRIVRRCLAKDPDARWQSASDLADELRWLSVGSGSGAVSGEPTSSKWRVSRVRPRTLIAGLISLLIVATIAGWWIVRQRGGEPPTDVRHQQITFSGNIYSAAISPDGRTIAYASGQQSEGIQVFVRDIASGQALEIWSGVYVFGLAWLPDGSHVLVGGRGKTAGGLWLIPRFGGTARPIRPWGSTSAISPDGSQLVVASQNEVGFRIFPLAGGPTRSTKLTGFRWTFALAWPRDNLLVILTATDENKRALWTVTPDGHNLRQLYADLLPIQAFCVSPAVDVVYAVRERSGAGELIRIPLAGGSATTLQSGFPVPNLRDPWLQCSISADGRRLVYTRGSAYANLWGLDVSRPGSNPTVITRGTSVFSLPSVSPDGQWIAVTEGMESNAHIVKLPSDGGERLRLGRGAGAVWSPDGARLAFASNRGGIQTVWISDAAGQNVIELKDSVLTNPLLWWLPDGRLAFQTSDARNYRIRDLTSGHEEMLVKDDSPGWVFFPSLSARGDRVAVHWNRPKEPGLWLLSWPERQERFLAARLTPIGWSADDRWIYAQPDAGRTILRVSAEDGKVEPVSSFSVGTFQDECDLTPDSRMVICSLAEINTDAWLIEGFDPAIRAQTSR